MNLERSVSRVIALWARWFAASTVALGLFAAYPVSQSSALQSISALIGWAVSFIVCIVSGFLAFWSLSRGHNTFLVVALGGIVAKLAIMAGAVFVGLAIAKLDSTSFLIALLVSYTLYHGLEVIMLNRSKAAISSPARGNDDATSTGAER